MTQVTMYLKGFCSLVRLARQDSTTPLVHWFTLACCTNEKHDITLNALFFIPYTMLNSRNIYIASYRVAVSPNGCLDRLLDDVRHLVHHKLGLLCCVVSHFKLTFVLSEICEFNTLKFFLVPFRSSMRFTVHGPNSRFKPFSKRKHPYIHCWHPYFRITDYC